MKNKLFVYENFRLLPLCYIMCTLIFSSVVWVVNLDGIDTKTVFTSSEETLRNDFDNLCKLDLSAKASCVMEVNTGVMLYGESQNTKLPMASTTKIMTGILIAENCNIEDEVLITRESAFTEGSSIYLQENERITVKELLYGLMLESGNDAAAALAIHCAGSQENFVRMMNEKANELSLTSTHFTNPHGLPDENHYTTARELAVLSCYAMKNQIFREVVSTKSYSTAKRYFSNHNKLLRLYDGASGVKTGFTKASGRCLVGCAERDGNMFVSVTLCAPDDWNDHIKLLNYAFENYVSEKLISSFEIFISGKTYCLPNDIYQVRVKDSKKSDMTYKLRCFKDKAEISVYDGSACIKTQTLNLKSTTSPSWIT